jgi:signal transduction histidine kinase
VISLRSLKVRRENVQPDRWRVLDACAAAVFMVGGFVGLGALHYSAQPPIVFFTVVVCTTTVAWRRRCPKSAALVALTAVAAYQRLTHDPQGVFESAAVVLDLYTAARFELGLARRRPLAALLAYALVVTVAIDAGSSDFSVGGVLLNWMPLAVLPVVAAHLIESHRDLNNRLTQTADELRLEQAARAERAAAIERNRLARELHDVVAHSVSVMVIQAGAARLLVADNPSGTVEALHLVVSSGRDALADLRRVMGVLRRNDPHDGSMRPGLAHLDRIFEPVRASGVDVEVHSEGTPTVPPPEVDLTAYRVVQEALTNVAKHAGPVTATVRIAYSNGVVELEIRNAGSSAVPTRAKISGSGQGLVGMRERVALCGGQLHAGPSPDGGFRVNARLPTRPEHRLESQAEVAIPPVKSGSWLGRWCDVILTLASVIALEAAVVGYGQRLLLNGVLVGLMSSACLWRRRAPLAFVAVTGALSLGTHGLAPFNRATVVGTFLVLIPTYTVGAWARQRRSVFGILLWVLGLSTAAIVHDQFAAGIFGALLMAILAWSAGRLVRNERDLAARLRRSTEALADEREQSTRFAVAEERERLARELQRQVAQLVVAMIVQAEAVAGGSFDDPELVQGIHDIEVAGREALSQMRHILGVLRGRTVAGDSGPVAVEPPVRLDRVLT